MVRAILVVVMAAVIICVGGCKKKEAPPAEKAIKAEVEKKAADVNVGKVVEKAEKAAEQ